MIRAICILVLLSVILAGCRTPKELTTDTKLKEQKNIENNVSVRDSSMVDRVVIQAVQKALNDKLIIKLNRVDYDTDKPIDPVTGKPPLKRETNIKLNKATNKLETDLSAVQTNEFTLSELVDKSKDKSKLEDSLKTKETNGFTLWETLGLCVAVSLFIGFITILTIKVK